MKVSARFTVVPDGVASNGRTLRVSIAAVPIKDENGPYDLESWPAAAADLARTLVLGVRPKSPGQNATGKVAVRRHAGPAAFDDALWQRIFSGLFGNLWTILTPVDEVLQADQLVSYQPGAFAEALDRVYAQVTLLSAAGGLNAARGFSPRGPSIHATNDTLTSTLPTDFWRILIEQHGLSDADRLAPDVASRVAEENRSLAKMAFGSTPEAARSAAVAEIINARMRPLLDMGAQGFAPLDLSSKASLARALAPIGEHLVRSESRWGNVRAEPEGMTEKTCTPEEDCWDPIADDETPEAVARRKFAGILAYPTLAKFLGLILDYEFNLTELMAAAGWSEPGSGERLYGEFAASVDGQPSQWTAFVLAASTVPQMTDCMNPGEKPASALRLYFGPCPETEFCEGQQGDGALLKDGLLNLSVPNRFKLTTIDTETAGAALLNRGRAVSAGERAGQRRDLLSTMLPSLNGRGIALVDDHPPLAALDRAAGETLFAEDLLVGYRIDAAVAHPTAAGQWKEMGQWRPLMARSLVFEDLPSGYQDNPDIAARAAREHAHTRLTVLHEKEAKDGKTEDIVSPVGQVVRWKGGSLALTSPDETDQNETREQTAKRRAARRPGDPDYVTVFDGDKDLAVNIVARLPPKASDEGPLPLRDEFHYMLGSRLCFQNGCSLSFEEARERYVSERGFALGKDSETPLQFARRDEIPAPDLLIPENAPLAIEEEMKSLCGETLETLVVRSHSSLKSTPNVTRFLVPPRTNPALAEQSGMFDESDEEVPSGALSQFMTLSPTLGDFPLSVKGDLAYPSEHVPDTTKPREDSRGPVAVFRKSGKPERPFYPDPWAQAAAAAFKVNCQAAPFYDQTADDFRFWCGTDPDAPLRARPVLLELEAKAPGKGKRGKIFGRRAASVPVSGGSDLVVDHLRIALAPGETAELMLWSAIEPAKASGHAMIAGAQSLAAALHQSNRLVPALKSVSTQALAPTVGPLLRTFAQGKSSKPLKQIMTTCPLSGVHHRRLVKLIHAVDRPLEDPEFILAPNLQLHAVVIKMRPAPQDGSSQAMESWRQYVEKQGTSDPLGWESEELGSTTFFTGTICIDRATTARVRCEADWLEETANALVKIGDKWKYAPAPHKDLVFTLKDISVPNGRRTRALSVLNDDAGDLRPNGFSFADGRARKLTLRLFAASRFAAYFPGGTDEGNARLFEKVSKTIRLIVPCTYRPPKVVVDRVLPRFRYKITPKGRRITAERFSWLRVYCAPDWPATGCDEGLAVVCGQEPATGTALEAFVSRAGTDPIHLDDAPGYGGTAGAHWIGPSHFRGTPEVDFKVRADLPLRVAKEDEPAVPSATSAKHPQKVTAIVFERTLDTAEGRWFFDLPIEPQGAYQPFLQLGLARHQPNAATKELVLSEPVATWAQIPPYRKLVVEFVKSRDLKITLSGPMARPGVGDDALQSTLNIKLLRAIENPNLDGPESERDWVPVLGSDNRPIELLARSPRFHNNALAWSEVIERPRFSKGAMFGLLVEEIELMPMDVQDIVIAACPDGTIDVKAPGLGERGPVYSQIIKFADRSWEEARREF